MYSIVVVNAITLKSGVNQVKYKDTITQKIYFTTATKYAKIDDITLSWKKGRLGTYIEDNTFDFDAKNNKLNNKENLDSINLKNLDYIKKYNLNIGDTLYYKFIAKSKSLINTLITSVAIVPQSMGSTNIAKLSASNNEFNLKTKDSKNGEIKYLSPTGFQVTTGTMLSFVKVTLPTGVKANDYFAKGNLSTAKPDFEKGTAVTSINIVGKNTIFLYKITRKDKNKKDVISYGLIKIGDILNYSTVGVVNFEYREGVLLGN